MDPCQEACERLEDAQNQLQIDCLNKAISEALVALLELEKQLVCNPAPENAGDELRKRCTEYSRTLTAMQADVPAIVKGGA